MSAWNSSGGFAFNLSPTQMTNISTAGSFADPSSIKDNTDFMGSGTAHVTLIWSPIKSVTTGIEYMYGQRVNVNDNSGEAHRLQMMLKYIF